MDQNIEWFEEFIRQEIDGHEEFKMPTFKVVCPRCQGTGDHVNPAIDGHGLSPNDPDLDEEFWDDYRSGVYNVTCYECGGKNVVDEVDEKDLSPEVYNHWQDWQREAAESYAIQQAEMRAGA